MTNPSGLLDQIVGKRPWSVQLGVGSFLLLDFGNPVKSADSVVRGEWHLWIYCAPWRIRTNDRLLLGSEMERERISTVIGDLRNRVVVGCRAAKPTLDLAIEFEGGIWLETFSIENTDAEHWLLYYPVAMVLAAGPGFRFRYGKADEPRDGHVTVENG